MDISATLLGGIAISLSTFFCVEWFIYNGQTIFTAIPISFVFVGFMNFLFEISLGSYLLGWGNLQKLFLVAKERKLGYFQHQIGKVLIGGLGILFSFVMLSYSIAAIVGAQYNDLTSKYVKPPEVEIVLDEDTIKNQIDESDKAKKSLEKEQATLLKKSEDNQGKLPIIDKQRLSELPGLIDAKQKEIEAKQLNKAKSSGSKKTEQAFNRGSVFQYLKDTIGLDPLMGQFLASALPSLFFDLISFICFAFLIYRKREPVKV